MGAGSDGEAAGTGAAAAQAGDGAGALELSGSSGWEERDPFREHPETYLGAAFAAGFLLARILRRIAA